MSKKKMAVMAALTVLVVLLNVWLWRHESGQVDDAAITFSVTAAEATQVSVYYSEGTAFDAEHVVTRAYETVGEAMVFEAEIPADTASIRLDFGDNGVQFVIDDLEISYRGTVVAVDLEKFSGEASLELHNVSLLGANTSGLLLETSGEDPYLSGEVDLSSVSSQAAARLEMRNRIRNLIYMILLDAAFLLFLRYGNRFVGLPVELIQNRKLVLNLAKNDFKTKYAGSYLGIFWAFVQPIVTVLVYWFVFQVGLRSGNVRNFPFVLWLVAGLVPWFFFQDTLNGGTNALIEYSYLVKKVVFKISVLPIVKAFSALFVHLFFVAFTLILYSCYGYFPDLYALQIVYYMFALFVFTLGLCYATCSVVIFFRDLTQIINIVLQVGIWMTPIMWDIDTMGKDMPDFLVKLLKLNPLYYIVNGYRDALINKVWFWERYDLTVIFWVVTAVFFVLGSVIFKRLKVHFADVL